MRIKSFPADSMVYGLAALIDEAIMGFRLTDYGLIAKRIISVHLIMRHDL
jgi:hypothetical protein